MAKKKKKKGPKKQKKPANLADEAAEEAGFFTRQGEKIDETLGGRVGSTAAPAEATALAKLRAAGGQTVEGIATKVNAALGRIGNSALQGTEEALKKQIKLFAGALYNTNPAKLPLSSKMLTELAEIAKTAASQGVPRSRIGLFIAAGLKESLPSKYTMAGPVYEMVEMKAKDVAPIAARAVSKPGLMSKAAALLERSGPTAAGWAGALLAPYALDKVMQSRRNARELEDIRNTPMPQIDPGAVNTPTQILRLLASANPEFMNIVARDPDIANKIAAGALSNYSGAGGGGLDLSSLGRIKMNLPTSGASANPELASLLSGL